MIDARGYSCPTPVVMVQTEYRRLNAPDCLEVLVDDPCAVQNVTRFGQNMGYQVETQIEGHDFRLTLSK